MLDFTKLWDKAYLFGPNPFSFSRSDFIFFGLAIALVAAAAVFKILVLRADKDSPRRFLLLRYFHLTATAGILTLLWAGARFENIPWLSTHFLVLLMFLGWLFWLGFILKYYFRQYRHVLRAWQEEKIKRKYLP